MLQPAEFEQILDRIASRETDPYSAVDGDLQAESVRMKAVIDHVGIAVADLDAVAAFYRDALGLEVEAPEEVPSQRVRAHFLPAADATLELLEATAADSPIAKFVAKRGPGLHHVTLRVDDIGAALARAEGQGRPADRRDAAARRARLARRLHPSGERPRRARRAEAARGCPKPRA